MLPGNTKGGWRGGGTHLSGYFMDARGKLSNLVSYTYLGDGIEGREKSFGKKTRVTFSSGSSNWSGSDSSLSSSSSCIAREAGGLSVCAARV